LSKAATSRPLCSSAPVECCTQWSGQRRVVIFSAGLSGLAIVVSDSKGMLDGAVWFEAKEMCDCGCQSLVAILIAKG